MGTFFRWCWTALEKISLADWLLAFLQTSVVGALAAIFAWIISLPILWTGLVAFGVAVVIWTVREINATIKRIEQHGTENPKLAYIQSGKSTYIRSERPAAASKPSAFIKCRISGEIANSYNVSAITDMGTGLLHIHFGEVFPSDDIVVTPVGAPPKNFTIVSADRSGVVVSFTEDDNPMIALKFEEANPEQERMQAEAAFQKGFYKARSGSPESARLLLAQLWEEGVEIRNHPMTVAHMFTPELDAWIQRITNWMEEVIEALEPLDAATSVWFRTLGYVGQARVPIPNIQLEGKEERARFVKAFCEHDMRLTRLKELLPRYEVGV